MRSGSRGAEEGGQLAVLPRVLSPGRRLPFAGLVGAGAGIALLSSGAAHLISRLPREPGPGAVFAAAAPLVAMVLGAALLRVAERRLAERLGQDYVHEVRKLLVSAALSEEGGPSLGITVARTTNDLTSVKNWITLGVSALAVGLPLIVVLTVMMWTISAPLAVALLAPLLALTLLLAILSRPAYSRARALRKKRGRLAGQITDTVHAAKAIRAAGGQARELERIDQLGRAVADAAVHRSTVAGALRASSYAAASLSSVAVVLTGTFGGVDHALIAGALTVLGMVAAPIHDLGRAVEYRQSFNAARRSMAPALRPTAPRPSDDRGPEDLPAGPLAVDSLSLRPGHGPISFSAQPGERLVLSCADPSLEQAFFDAVLGLTDCESGDISLGSLPLASSAPRLRRRLVGYAARALPLERGSISRAVRYRVPDAPEDAADTALAQAGFAPDGRLPKGMRTVLKRGGAPLATADRAKVHVARAMLGNPPLLLLDHIDADLDPEGAAALKAALGSYPGIAVVASADPGRLVDSYRTLTLDGDRA